MWSDLSESSVDWGLTGPARAACGRLRGRAALSHAYILCGPEGSGRHDLARWMAARYVCSGEGETPCGQCPDCRKAAAGIHPDIITAAEALKAADARALRADAYIRPNEAARKVYLVEDAQEMNASAQNALLKVLEEGPDYAAFLLLAENEAALLPTIRSRCELLRLQPPAQPEDGRQQPRQEAVELAALLEGREELSLLTFALSLEKWEKAELSALLDDTLTVLRDRLLAGTGDLRRLMGLAEHVKTLRSACEFNLGQGHLAGWLAAGAAAQ